MSILLDKKRFFCYNVLMINNVIIAENKELKKQISDLSEQVKFLTEQNLLYRQMMFGRKSEQKIEIIPDGQLNLFNETELESDSAVIEPQLEEITYKRKKQKGKRESDFSKLPTRQIIHELSENERICSECGESVHACGHDVLRRELTIVPAQYIVTEHV